MRLALYARVSTRTQKSNPQLTELRRYARARKAKVVEEFVDHGLSRAKDRRPALDRLLAGARRREFDAVAVTKLDRLARSVRHLTTVSGEFEALGVDLIVVDQGLDTSTPTGRLAFNMIGAIAEFERDLIKERVTAGLRAAVRNGTKLGRPAKADRRMRDRIVRLARAGKTHREIADLTDTSKGTVHRVLTAASG